MKYIFLLTAFTGLILFNVYFPVVVPGALLLIIGLIGYQFLHMRLYRKKQEGDDPTAGSHVLPAFLSFFPLQAIYTPRLHEI